MSIIYIFIDIIVDFFESNKDKIQIMQTCLALVKLIFDMYNILPIFY